MGEKFVLRGTVAETKSLFSFGERLINKRMVKCFLQKIKINVEACYYVINLHVAESKSSFSFEERLINKRTVKANFSND